MTAYYGALERQVQIAMPETKSVVLVFEADSGVKGELPSTGMKWGGVGSRLYMAILSWVFSLVLFTKKRKKNLFINDY